MTSSDMGSDLPQPRWGVLRGNPRHEPPLAAFFVRFVFLNERQLAARYAARNLILSASTGI